MKNFTSTLFLALPMVLVLAFSSCKKDPTFTEQFVGTWDVTSATEDGVETINFFIQSWTIRFDEIVGSEGGCRFTVVFADGSTDVSNGFYTVNEDNETVRLEFDGEITRLDANFTGNFNTLTLSGNIDGTSVVIRASRQ